MTEAKAGTETKFVDLREPVNKPTLFSDLKGGDWFEFVDSHGKPMNPGYFCRRSYGNMYFRRSGPDDHGCTREVSPLTLDLFVRRIYTTERTVITTTLSYEPGGEG